MKCGNKRIHAGENSCVLYALMRFFFFFFVESVSLTFRLNFFFFLLLKYDRNFLKIFEIFLRRFTLKRMIISRILFLIKSYIFYYFVFPRWRRKLLSMKRNRMLFAKCYPFLPIITNIASCYQNQWTIFRIIVQGKMFQCLLKLFIKYLV